MKHSKHTKKIITRNTTVTVTTRSRQPDEITIRTAKNTRLEMSCPGLKLDPVPSQESRLEVAESRLKVAVQKMREMGILKEVAGSPVREPGWFLEDEDR